MLFSLQLQAETPLDRMARAVRSHHAVSGTLRLVTPGARGEWRFRFLAPDCVRLEEVGFESILVTDGRSAWGTNDAQRSYHRLDPRIVYASANVFLGYNLMLKVSAINYLDLLREALVEGGGRGAPAFAFSLPSGPVGSTVPIEGFYRSPQSMALYFWRSAAFPQSVAAELDPTSALPLRMRALRTDTPEEYRYADVVLDPPLRRTDFRFAPPEGYRDEALPYTPPPSGNPDHWVRVIATPGRWSEDSVPSLRVEPKVRSYLGNWVFDLQSRDDEGLDWRRGSVLVRVGGAWRDARLVARPDRHRALATVPRGASGIAPDMLQVTLGIGAGGRPMTYLFRWKP